MRRLCWIPRETTLRRSVLRRRKGLDVRWFGLEIELRCFFVLCRVVILKALLQSVIFELA